MEKKSTAEPFGSRGMWETLEEMARERIQGFVQELLEEEVTALVGRGRSERRPVVSEGPVVYRNCHGKARRLAMTSGTIEVRRPRVRGMEERFDSQVLPLFKRRTEEIGELLPQLYLHGLAQGELDRAIAGQVGGGVRGVEYTFVGGCRAGLSVGRRDLREGRLGEGQGGAAGDRGRVA